MNRILTGFLGALLIGLASCQSDDKDPVKNPTPSSPSTEFPALSRTFGTRVNLRGLANYANQPLPAYITRYNSMINVSDAKATLGRVLFYDKLLSIDNTVSCASCHKQSFAFSDSAEVSSGVLSGRTGRHSMRLVNARFSAEPRFFWDERAATLSAQTTQPIQDHHEMGYSGQSGRPVLASLLSKLEATDYYNELFTFVYGDKTVTEARLQESLTHFILSIQSFDSKYDQGRAGATNDAAAFSNFTAAENRGKTLFLNPPGPVTQGAGCAGCHTPPEFSIDTNSRNNGIIGTAAGTGTDLSNTRSPSLRDLADPSGRVNGPLFHTGQTRSLLDVINHYNRITRGTNTNLDPRLQGPPPGAGQNLNLTQTQKDDLVAFLLTLRGSALYTDARWSNPFGN